VPRQYVARTRRQGQSSGFCKVPPLSWRALMLIYYCGRDPQSSLAARNQRWSSNVGADGVATACRYLFLFAGPGTGFVRFGPRFAPAEIIRPGMCPGGTGAYGRSRTLASSRRQLCPSTGGGSAPLNLPGAVSLLMPSIPPIRSPGKGEKEREFAEHRYCVAGA